MYQISRWKLEKGAALGTLEQLLGSRTIGSAILTQFQLRSLNLLGVSLISVWAFSPLGGQSFLRMLRSRFDIITSPSEMDYLETNGLNLFQVTTNDIGSDTTSPEDLQGLIAGATALLDGFYNTALTSSYSLENSTMDVWENPKIPLLSSFGDMKNPEWQQVPTHPAMEYSALVGLPITNISVGNTTFSIESTYLNFECVNISTVWSNPSKESHNQLSRIVEPRISYNDSIASPILNGTWQGFPANSSEGASTWEIAVDRFIDPQ